MDALPSVPRVLVGILDVLQDDAVDLRKLSDVILQDIGLTTRVIAAASSIPDKPRRGFDSLEQAIRTLGLPTVKAMVITAAIQYVFEQFSPHRQNLLNRLWRRALTTACLAKSLAILTGYRRPEEAYLAGLLADLGRLVHLTAVESEYDRLLAGPEDDDDSRHFATAPFGSGHVDAAVELMEGWGLDPFVVDAVRYHLEPVRKIRDAHHLVKLVSTAYAMASSELVSDQALATADLLFGLDEGLTRELHRHAGDEVARLAAALQIDIGGNAAEIQSDNDRITLGKRLQDLEQLEQLTAALAQVKSPQLPHSAVQRAVFLALGVEVSAVSDRHGCSLSPCMDRGQRRANLHTAARGRAQSRNRCIAHPPHGSSDGVGTGRPLGDRPADLWRLLGRGTLGSAAGRTGEGLRGTGSRSRTRPTLTDEEAGCVCSDSWNADRQGAD